MNNKNNYRIAIMGLLSTLVFVSSMIGFSVPLSFGGDFTKIHIGNIFCLLSGLILGPIYGGLAAGIGSAFYDLTDPIFISSMPFTFCFKFIMAYICGKIAYSFNKNALSIKTNILAGMSGIIVYIILNLSRTFIVDIYFKELVLNAALLNIFISFISSAINGVIAVCMVIPLNISIRKILETNNIFEKIRYNGEK